MKNRTLVRVIAALAEGALALAAPRWARKNRRFSRPSPSIPFVRSPAKPTIALGAAFRISDMAGRVLGFVLCLFLMVWAPLGVPSIALGQDSRIEQGQVFSSALTNNLLGDSGTRPFSVYLPASYDSTQKRYPAVYVLHGYYGSHTEMEAFLQPSLDSMTAGQMIGEMIVVFVCGTNRLWGCQYLSSPVIGDYETYLAKDLVGYIDAHYRTLPTRNSRGLTGYSMGGWGAMHLALKFPEVFSVVVPNAGYYNAVGDDAQYAFRLLAQDPPTNLVQFDSLAFPVNWAQSLLAGLLPDLQRPELYTDYPYELANGQLVAVDTAQQRLRDGDVSHGDLERYLKQPVRLNAIKIVCGTNDSLITQARDFANALTAAGVQFAYEEHSGGHLYVPELSLPFLSANLQDAKLGPPEITQQPQSCTNAAGTTATFTVTAAGMPPLLYQWQRDSGSLSFWNLAGCTNATLVLTNVGTSDAVNYCVVVTNSAGAVASAVAHLTVVTSPQPPQIIPTTALQHQAVFVGQRASFTVTASGTAPLAYQWRLDGYDLAGRTNRTLTLSAVQPADEGDYTVVVTNVAGTATSYSSRLWVAPPATLWIKTNFTNNLGRLPYFCFLPTNYTAARTYPLWLAFHGTPGDEGYATTFPWPLAWVSYRQQQRDPVIAVYPTRRVGDETWTDAYLRQVSALLDDLISRFSVDTNRIYVMGGSEGLHAAWDLMGMRPGFFAGAHLQAGWQGSAKAASIRDIPAWIFCAKDDGLVGDTQLAVRALRLAGGSPIYTEYATGGHDYGIGVACTTPVVIDWLLAQRRGTASRTEPLLKITRPTAEAFLPTAATNLSLSGSVHALDQDVIGVTWQNWANNHTGPAMGTNTWSITDLPLVSSRTNLISVIGTTTTWSPSLGGNTTFNDTLTVVCSLIQATLALEGTTALLNWTGGGPPYRIQRATDLAIGDWTGFFSNATPPVALSLTNAAGFYRILGQ